MGASDQAYTAWKIPRNTKAKMACPQAGWVKMRSIRVVRAEASSHGNSGPLGMRNSALFRMCSMRQPASSSWRAADDSSSVARAASSALVCLLVSQVGRSRARKYQASCDSVARGKWAFKASKAVPHAAGVIRSSRWVLTRGSVSANAVCNRSFRSFSKWKEKAGTPNQASRVSSRTSVASVRLMMTVAGKPISRTCSAKKRLLRTWALSRTIHTASGCSSGSSNSRWVTRSSSALANRLYVPGRSTSCTPGWAFHGASYRSTVTPGMLLTLARRPVRRLKSVVLPQLGLPTSAIFTGQISGFPRRPPIPRLGDSVAH